MNIKRIVLFTVVLMITVASLSIVSAGWFDNSVETDTFKFEKPSGFSGSGENGTVILQKDSNQDYIIGVSEIDKDNYTQFMEKDFSVPEETDGNTFSSLSHAELQKDIKEDNMRIVVRHAAPMGLTNAVIQKDNSYYFITIQHPYHTEEIAEDIQLVKDINDSLEKL